MPRKPASVPSFHRASGQFYFYVKRKPVYLGKDYDKALKRMRAMLLAETADKPAPAPVTDTARLPLRALAAMYLENLDGHKEPRTVESARERLARAWKYFDKNFPCGEFRQYHLDEIRGKMKGYSPTTVNCTLGAIMRMFSWASQRLDGNKLHGYKLPAERQRNRVVTDEEFRRLLKACVGNLSLRHLLVASRVAGCRPSELRILTWDMIDWQEGVAVLVKHKTTNTQQDPRPRMIPLPPSLVARLRWIQARSKSDHVFVNFYGKPYTKNAVVHAFDRARKRAGIVPKHGEALVFYSARHTFATNGLGKVTDMELANIMGHTSTRTLRRYTHPSAAQIKASREKLG